MRLSRLPHWHESLKLYLDRVSEEPFKWGEHDCLNFAAGAVKAMTGVDLMDGMKGAYSSEEEALQFLRDNGYKTVRNAVSKKLGKAVHPAYAGKGDIVWREDAKQVGVCVGTHSWFVGEEPVMLFTDGTSLKRQGLVHYPTLSCKYAWKV